MFENKRGVANAGWGCIFVWGVGTPLPTMEESVIFMDVAMFLFLEG